MLLFELNGASIIYYNNTNARVTSEFELFVGALYPLYFI